VRLVCSGFSLRAAAEARYVRGRNEPVTSIVQPMNKPTGQGMQRLFLLVLVFLPLPAFAEANRRNAYQVYLSMEAESLSNQK